MFTKQSVLALSAIMLVGCANNASYTSVNNGVVVTTQGGQASKVRLVVINDNIIRVTAAPDTLSSVPSLIAVEQNAKPDYTVASTDSTVTVSTKALSAIVSLRTGQVAFTYPDGSPIISENNDRSFEQIDVDGLKQYTISQTWTSPANEAIYGLGQHQSQEFNYKGLNEELFQYNTKVSLPFIISTEGYGILWDNYSITRYGDKRPFARLDEAFTVYDKDGKQGGLTGTWLPKQGQTLVRTEPFLCFEHEKGNNEYLPKGFPLDGSNVTFEGFLEPKESGTHRFQLYYAGYMKLYIDDNLIVPEIWRTAWNPNTWKFSANLEAHKKHKLRIEWEPDGGVSYCGLRALTPVPDAQQQRVALWSEVADQIDYYFIHGATMDDVISGYRTITGKAQIMPKWVMGYWQSRQRYKTQDEIVGELKTFRAKGMPIDGIVQDWNYWEDDQWGAFEFDKSRFPDPKKMVDDIHAMNARIMISTWPKFYIGTEHYKEFKDKGWTYEQCVKDSIYDWLGYMYSFYDAYAPGARKLFWNQMNEHLYSLGIDSWWMDASEPNIRDCTDMEYRKQLCGPTALGPSAKYFNTYSIVNAMAIYDGQRSVNDTSRVFLLTRSGFPGLQRYSTATWSGDIASRWEDMKAQITAGLNFSIAGIPYWTMDIGGFCVEKRYSQAYDQLLKTGKENADYKEWKELQTRWYQFGAFAPIFRSHGEYPLREPWYIASENDPAYKSIAYYINLRYALMPYIYTLAAKTWFSDYTIMRPLAMDYTADANTYNVADQFFLGNAIMACPVCEYGKRERPVYLPAGKGWYDFYTGQHIDGGQTITASAPYERIPLFIPDGSIIPLGNDIQSTVEQQVDLTIMVYAGANGKFQLYEDEGTNYNYEAKYGEKYSTINFAWDDANRTFQVGARQGDFKGMPAQRNITVVLVDANNPQALSNKAKGQTQAYNGQPIQFQF